jgi:hypothetical protein
VAGPSGGRFKLEFRDLPGSEPMWFDTREELDATVDFLRACPVDDGPVRLRITELGVLRTEDVP